MKAWIIFLIVIIGAVLVPAGRIQAGPESQIPTVAIPTVTGTPVGALAVVLDNDQGYVNVRAGPSTVAYEIVGMLVEGQSVPALARTSGGDWIQIAYPGVAGGVGWIWSDLVDVRGDVPIIDPPPTPTPQITATIDPTLAAQFLVEAPPTRLPTFTPAPQFVQSTLPADAPLATPGRLPIGMIIIGMAAIGAVGLLISFLGGR